MVLLKAEAAELLLPSIFVNIAARKDMEIDLHKLISLQVIFYRWKPCSFSPLFVLIIFIELLILSFSNFENDDDINLATPVYCLNCWTKYLSLLFLLLQMHFFLDGEKIQYKYILILSPQNTGIEISHK